MPGKMAGSACSTTVGAAPRDGSRPNLASILQEGERSANIHSSSGVIRGIPVKGGADA